MHFTLLKLACTLEKVDILNILCVYNFLLVCAALSRSRMRVKDVLQIELPSLISKEFSPVKENDQFSAAECPMSIIPYMHQAKWTARFNQMDKELYEEMNDLVSSMDFILLPGVQRKNLSS